MFALRIVKSAAVSIGLVVLIATTLQAAPAHRDSGEFVTELGNRAIELLGSKTASEEEQERRFRYILREGFAVRKIGKFVLGKYRRSATKGEISEFLDLFEDYIVSLYSSAFRSYSGETFVVSRIVKTRSPRDTMVVAHINPDAPDGPTKVVFQVRRSIDDYKILDVKIQGVSMIVTQRDEFTGFIRNNGGKVAALIKALRKKTAALRTRAGSAQ
tara:strand:- start:112 stop:756 length:645 start_codon:yes stop_codon:yes gene_type:complete